MNERRLFFAIPLSDPLRKRLAKEMGRWEDLPLFLSRPEHLHVTVSFLGFVPDEDVAEISEVARDICASSEPFELLFTGTELAPDADRPKMVWLSGEESGPLRDLRNAFEAGFSDKRSESRSFRPHVTLAKLKRYEFSELPEEKRSVVSKKLVLSEPVSSVVLFESIGTGAKLEYLPMGEFPLGE